MDYTFEAVGTGIVRCRICNEYMLWSRPAAYGIGLGEQETQHALDHMAQHKQEGNQNEKI